MYVSEVGVAGTGLARGEDLEFIPPLCFGIVTGSGRKGGGWNPLFSPGTPFVGRVEMMVSHVLAEVLEKWWDLFNLLPLQGPFAPCLSPLGAAGCEGDLGTVSEELMGSRFVTVEELPGRFGSSGSLPEPEALYSWGLCGEQKRRGICVGKGCGGWRYWGPHVETGALTTTLGCLFSAGK